MEYDPADVVALIEPIEHGVADVVYGSRLQRRRAAARVPVLASRRQPLPVAADRRAVQHDAERHGDRLQGIPRRRPALAAPDRRTTSRSSRRSRARSAGASCASTRCRSRTTGARTRRARTSPGATGSRRFACCSAFACGEAFSSPVRRAAPEDRAHPGHGDERPQHALAAAERHQGVGLRQRLARLAIAALPDPPAREQHQVARLGTPPRVVVDEARRARRAPSASTRPSRPRRP